MHSSKDRRKLLNYLNRRKYLPWSSNNPNEKHSQQLEPKNVEPRPSSSFANRNTNDKIKNFVDEEHLLTSIKRIVPNSTQNKRKSDADNENGDVNLSRKTSAKKNQKKKRKTAAQIVEKDQNLSMLKQDVERFLAEHKNNLNNNVDDDDNEEEFPDFDEGLKTNSDNFISKSVKKFQNKDLIEIEQRSQQLAQKAQRTLATSMFRYLNEYLYTHPSYEARKTFNQNKFEQYHHAYERIMEQWPLKPIDFIIDQLRQRIKSKNMNQVIIADIGCGKQARIAQAFPQTTVYSYDLYPTCNDQEEKEKNQCSNGMENIIAADMCRLPLDSDECDYCVYSLSLMPTNLREVFCEANRILKPKSSYMIIVEVASRFADYITNKRPNDKSSKSYSDGSDEKHKCFEKFSKDLCQFYGFRLIEHQLLPPNDYFVYFLFKKVSSIQNKDSKKSLPPIQLKPCVYKLREKIKVDV